MSWILQQKDHRNFLEGCPEFEKDCIAGNGIILGKFWMEVSSKEQERRFQARVHDQVRQWKLSPMDLPSRSRWYDYSRARDLMLDATDTDAAPWYIVRADDKKAGATQLHLSPTEHHSLQRGPQGEGETS